MAATSPAQPETIELSEAIRTILAESYTPTKAVSPSGASEPIGHDGCRAASVPSVDLDSSSGSGQDVSHVTPTRAKPKGEHGVETPLSRKSSILQRSLGSDYHSQSAPSPKKRKHAHDVIILRPPKKRSVGSTPRVTSTTRVTTPVGSGPQALESTPASRAPKPRILQSRASNGKNKHERELKTEPPSPGGVAATPDLSLASPGRLSLPEAIEKLSPREREELALRARCLGLLDQQRGEGQQGNLADFSGSMEALLQEACRQGLGAGQGGLSLDVSDQTGKISLVARGNQDDSLTNITWLRRMSAPDLDPGTLKQLKDPHKDRPPYSYSSLIQFAISSAPEGRLTLRDIYFWIETNFPYFRTAKLGWKNSIRHNLSLHKIFVREAPSGPGQPAHWTLRPGTVVRMPERSVVVHDEVKGQGGSSRRRPRPLPPLQPRGVLPVPGAPLSMGEEPGLAIPTEMGLAGTGFPRMVGGSRIPVDMNSLAGSGMLLGDSSGLTPLLPKQEGLGGAPVLTSTPVITRPSSRGSKRVPPILPKGAPPYALVPLPIYFTADPSTGQLVPTNSDAPPPRPPNAAPSPILPKPVIMEKCGRKQKITPKVAMTTPTRRPKARPEHSESGVASGSTRLGIASRNTMDSGYGSTDSSVGEENAPLAKGAAQSQSSEGGAPTTVEKENALSAEFDLGLDVGDDLLKTPPKGAYPDWLSPIRGFTPGADSGFPLRDVDFNFTPLKMGLLTPTPGGRGSCALTPRRSMLSPLQRNAVLGGLQAGGRSGRKAKLITPRRFPQYDGDRDLPCDSLHNSSFEHMFGDVEFDVDPDSIDVGSMSWLLQTPPPAK